jgi:hypothetical protein
LCPGLPCVSETVHHDETQTHQEPAASQPVHVSTLRARTDTSDRADTSDRTDLLVQGIARVRDRYERRGAVNSATSGPFPSSAPGPAPDVLDALPHAWKRSTRGRVLATWLFAKPRTRMARHTSHRAGRRVKMGEAETFRVSASAFSVRVGRRYSRGLGRSSRIQGYVACAREMSCGKSDGLVSDSNNCVE